MSSVSSGAISRETSGRTRGGAERTPEALHSTVGVPSKAERAKVLSNLLAELIVGGIHLKEAGLYGSYDLVRGVVAQLERQYRELLEEDDGAQ